MMRLCLALLLLSTENLNATFVTPLKEIMDDVGVDAESRSDHVVAEDVEFHLEGGRKILVSKQCLEQVEVPKWHVSWGEFIDQYTAAHPASIVPFLPVLIVKESNVPSLIREGDFEQVAKSLGSSVIAGAAACILSVVSSPVWVPYVLVTMGKELAIGDCPECGQKLARNASGWDGGQISCHNPACPKRSNIISVRSDWQGVFYLERLALRQCKRAECHHDSDDADALDRAAAQHISYHCDARQPGQPRVIAFFMR